MRLVLIAAKGIPLTAVGRNTADLASNLPTNEEVTPTQIEAEGELYPFAVQVNVRTRTEEVIAGEVLEEAEETIKGKAVLMRWMPSSTPSRLWTTMEVDEEYEIGEGEDLDHQPIFEQWDEDNSDRVFVDGEQIAGPSKPFRARSYSFEL
jgi:hypothetical protein